MLNNSIFKEKISRALEIKNISSIRVENFTPLWVKNFSFHTLKNRFTGIKTRVNLPAGKSLGGSCLFLSQSLPPRRRGSSSLLVAGGDAKSRKTGLGVNDPQGQLRDNLSPLLLQEHTMHSSVSLKTIFQRLPSKVLLASLFVGVLCLPCDLMASDGLLLKTEITALEKLFIGGYMRIGLLGVCGFAAICGIVKQSGWIFASGILGCVFAYFMKDWILNTFTLVV